VIVLPVELEQLFAGLWLARRTLRRVVEQGEIGVGAHVTHDSACHDRPGQTITARTKLQDRELGRALTSQGGNCRWQRPLIVCQNGTRERRMGDCTGKNPRRA